MNGRRADVPVLAWLVAALAACVGGRAPRASVGRPPRAPAVARPDLTEPPPREGLAPPAPAPRSGISIDYEDEAWVLVHRGDAAIAPPMSGRDFTLFVERLDFDERWQWYDTTYYGDPTCGFGAGAQRIEPGATFPLRPVVVDAAGRYRLVLHYVDPRRAVRPLAVRALFEVEGLTDPDARRALDLLGGLAARGCRPSAAILDALVRRTPPAVLPEWLDVPLADPRERVFVFRRIARHTRSTAMLEHVARCRDVGLARVAAAVLVEGYGTAAHARHPDAVRLVRHTASDEQPTLPAVVRAAFVLFDVYREDLLPSLLRRLEHDRDIDVRLAIANGLGGAVLERAEVGRVTAALRRAAARADAPEVRAACHTALRRIRATRGRPSSGGGLDGSSPELEYDDVRSRPARPECAAAEAAIFEAIPTAAQPLRTRAVRPAAPE